jgi:hypothetical protein
MPSDILVTRRDPMTTLRLVTDAIVAELAAHWTDLEPPEGFIADPQRIYNTELPLDESQNGSLDAVMGDVEIVMFDRKLKQYDCRVDIVVRQRVELNDIDTIDALADFLGRVTDFFSPSDQHDAATYYRQLTALPEAVWNKSEILAPYIPEHLRSIANQYTGVAMVTYQVIG